MRGLETIGVSYALDPPLWRASANVGVLSGIEALHWAIAEKVRGRQQVLVVGPNIVILPSDIGTRTRWDVVDRILVPSDWVRQKYVADTPSLSGRIEVWSAGVDETFWLPAARNTAAERRELLLYEKSGPPELRENVESALVASGLPYTVIQYGSYTLSSFRDRLQRSAGMVFLSESESQGLALFEAWACDVPTLVWDRQLWIRPNHPEQQWAGASAAPYLNDENGLAFRGEADFPARLQEFLGLLATFRPRDFILRGHTLAQAASRYWEFFD